jgi:putative hydrolase of the HAD superfamily
VQQQERKLRHTGLDRYVAGWVISEQLGVKKPDPLIFRRAAEQVGSPLNGGWMIGDSATADIAGARNVALRSVWLHRGRVWTEPDYKPDLFADNCPAAIDAVITTG